MRERNRKSTTKLSTKVTTGSKRDQRNRSKELKTEGRGQKVGNELDGNMEREEMQRTAESEKERLETN